MNVSRRRSAIPPPTLSKRSTVRTTYARGNRLSIDARGYLNGVPHVRLASGPYATRWLTSAAAGIPRPQ